MAKMILVTMSLFYLSSIGADSSPYLKGSITWSELKVLERKMEKWADKVGDKDLIAIGKMRQRPHEVEVIRYFYPHLLPKGFFGRSLDLSCFSDFTKFKKAKDKISYLNWKTCVMASYNENLPKLLQRAVNDLKP